MQKAAGNLKYHIHWVDKRERMPTEKDADEHGTILAYHTLNGTVPSTPKAFVQYGTYMTHWARMPEPPEGKEGETVV